MQHVFRGTVFCTAMLLSLLCVSIGNADIVYDGYGRPTEVPNLAIGTELYDVSVTYNVPFTDIFESATSPSPVPLFWNEFIGGQEAASAIADALNSDASAPSLNSINPPVNIWTPYGYSSSNGQVTVSTAWGDNPPSLAWDVYSRQYIPEDSLSVSGGWAQYTAVPEPSTLVLFSLLSAMGLLVGWRRRKRATACGRDC